MKCQYKNCSNEVEENNFKQKYCSLRCKRNHGTQKARKKLKIMAVEHKGGKCEKCGYDKCIGALQFHHVDPSQKDFNIGGHGETRAWETIRKEIDKCILLCANCHAEEHEELNKQLS